MTHTLNINTDTATRAAVTGVLLSAIRIVEPSADAAYVYAGAAGAGLNLICYEYARVEDTAEGRFFYRAFTAADFNATAGVGTAATSITVSDDDYTRAGFAASQFSATVAEIFGKAVGMGTLLLLGTEPGAAEGGPWS